MSWRRRLSVWVPSMAFCSVGRNLVQIRTCYERNYYSMYQDNRNKWTWKLTLEDKSCNLGGSKSLSKDKIFYRRIETIKKRCLRFDIPCLPSRVKIQCHFRECIHRRNHTIFLKWIKLYYYWQNQHLYWGNKRERIHCRI